MIYKKVMVFILVLLSFTSNFNLGVKVALADFDCLTLSSSATADQRQFCQNELDQLLKQLADLNNQLSSQKKQTGTITGDIKYLTSQINALTTKIKARTLAIAQLKVSINEKTNHIEILTEKIDREHASLAQLLRNTNELDDANIMHLILSDQNLSSFYSDVESYADIKQSIKTSVEQVTSVKVQTEAEKTDLQKQKDAQADAKAELERAQKQVTQTQADKKILLVASKKKESDQVKVIGDIQKRVATIKSRLFALAGGGAAIRFDLALQYAEAASAKTRIDPAFLLAIITQESKLGANVGQCYLSNADTGAGVGKNTGTAFPNVMKPTRDVQPFLEITNALNFNAFQTAVSCPIKGVAGWGGAMGPAQFIPSTWKLFTSRIASINGSSPTNPWWPPDAFIASALYLTDLGAVGESTSAQSRAACKYYGSGGSTCSYSRNVMTLKASIQSDIDYLKLYGVAKS